MFGLLPDVMWLVFNQGVPFLVGGAAGFTAGFFGL